MNEEEYIIINKTAIQKRIEELEIEISYHHKKKEHLVCKELSRIKLELEELLSQSTPLIPENIKPLQELVDEGYDPYDSAHHLQVQEMLKVIQDYISKLKLDI